MARLFLPVHSLPRDSTRGISLKRLRLRLIKQQSDAFNERRSATGAVISTGSRVGTLPFSYHPIPPAFYTVPKANLYGSLLPIRFGSTRKKKKGKKKDRAIKCINDLVFPTFFLNTRGYFLRPMPNFKRGNHR